MSNPTLIVTEPYKSPIALDGLQSHDIFHEVARTVPGYDELVERTARFLDYKVAVPSAGEAVVAAARAYMDGTNVDDALRPAVLASDARKVSEVGEMVRREISGTLSAEADSWYRTHAGRITRGLSALAREVEREARELFDGPLLGIRSADDDREGAEAEWKRARQLARRYEQLAAIASAMLGTVQSLYPASWIVSNYAEVWPDCWLAGGADLSSGTDVGRQLPRQTAPWLDHVTAAEQFRWLIEHGAHLTVPTRAEYDQQLHGIRAYTAATVKARAAAEKEKLSLRR
ncbi:hypothetical protein C5B93_01085 [Rathayibacter sp. AY1A2]|uniref:hypothetical protein n=1 Tax=Rathayibacter sp. AY1A2 TaxID=2080520 RepID=UPI000CE73861|nr:hypothetical protein [Rathayibacter sp. AY1A2]PPF41336.1 hypothetical protein C5B93_01085 [Rathayibacter sp. AY1A2]